MSTPYRFTGQLQAVQIGFMRQMMYIPSAGVEQLGIKANMRLMGTLNGTLFKRAALSDGVGQFYLSLGAPLCKEAKIKVGQMVEVVIDIDPHPTELDLPEEWLAVLEQDEEAKTVFDSLTLGYQRSLMYYITSAKRTDTRIKRALQMATKLRNRNLQVFKEK